VHGTSTVNLRHEPVELDVVARHLLPLLDGTNDAAALAASLNQAVKSETIGFVREGQRVTDDAEIEACIADHLGRVLRQLEGQAVLLPSETGAKA
jgi:methyltransferase-like protein